MHKKLSLSLAATLIFIPALLQAQELPAPHDDVLRVTKADINAEQEDAELCLNFDKALYEKAANEARPARVASNIKLTLDGNPVNVENIALTPTSLCLFPLERAKGYRLALSGMHGAHGEKMDAAYTLSFNVPDRTPSMAFINSGGFASYDIPLTLRMVNVRHAKIELYRITDLAGMGYAWQQRAQTGLAPSESAYFARTKGQSIARSESDFDNQFNVTVERQFPLREMFPDLAPGLYLFLLDSGNGGDKPASKGLSPLAAIWFTKSDFSLTALSDSDGVHAFATSNKSAQPKGGIHLYGMNKKPEQIAEAQGNDNGIDFVPKPQNKDSGAIDTIIASDAAGNVAFADVEALPAPTKQPTPGSIELSSLFTPPGEQTSAHVALLSEETNDKLASSLELLRNDTVYTRWPLTGSNTSASILAPASQGMWDLRWQQDGLTLAEHGLQVSSNPDAPHFEITSDNKNLGDEIQANVTIRSVSASNKPVALAGGKVTAFWQKYDAGSAGWKNYQFGIPVELDNHPEIIADTLTDMQGKADLHLSLPKPPQDTGLYQAVIGVTAEADSGIADAEPIILPLKPDISVVGIKPLATDGRFAQNGIARFSLIALASDGKLRDRAKLSYQVYEEGRGFAWYQDEGRWKYKPEPQLRPIGGGDIAIRADGNSILEWPVTAGNYLLEILDSDGDILAQDRFSAGWDSAGEVTPLPGLPVSLPKTLTAGREATLHVNLPEAAMLTVVVSDQHIRKVVHEFRQKGDNTVGFMPASDWRNGVTVSIDAEPVGASGIAMHKVVEAALTETAEPAKRPEKSGAVLIASSAPAAAPLREDARVTLLFGIQNVGSSAETYRYSFSSSAGAKIEDGEKGVMTLQGGESRALPVTVFGQTAGARELKLEAISAHGMRAVRNWPLAVLPKEDFMEGSASFTLDPQQSLGSANLKAHAGEPGAYLLASRRGTEGLPEILSYVYASEPFTVSRLALVIEALRLWNGTLVQSGFVPETALSAHRQELMLRLLRRQNSDGGFATMRGGESDIGSTAAALLALGPDGSELIAPAKALAISWIKQQLTNTWYDEKERTPRAAAYAGLASADAIDAASLHYFSDTNAQNPMSAEAEANMAAAFKHIRDPYAAAFWIKKMLTEHGEGASPALLGDLAATDALSSDQVHAAMREIAAMLRQGRDPDMGDAASLLRAAYVDNATAGRTRIMVANDTHDIVDVMALRSENGAWPSIHNPDGQPLSITLAHFSPKPASNGDRAVSRHVYRLNGVEMPAQMKPAKGDVYVIEIKGSLGAAKGQKILLQDGNGAELHPIGCPLSPKLENLPFIPWLVMHGLTPIEACEVSPYGIGAVFAHEGNDNESFRAVYLATIDAASVGALTPPRARLLQ